MSSFFGPTITTVQEQHRIMADLSNQAAKTPAKFKQLSAKDKSKAEEALKVAKQVISNLTQELSDKKAEQAKLTKEQNTLLQSATTSTVPSDFTKAPKILEKINAIALRMQDIQGKDLTLANALKVSAESILNLPQKFKAERSAEIDKLSEELSILENRPLVGVDAKLITAVEDQAPTFFLFRSHIPAAVEALKALPIQTEILEAEFAYAHALLFALKTNDDPDFIRENKEFSDNNEALIQALKRRRAKISTLLDSARNIASKLENAMPGLTEATKKELQTVLSSQKQLIETLEEANNPSPKKPDKSGSPSSTSGDKPAALKASSSAAAAAAAAQPATSAVDAATSKITPSDTKEIDKVEKKQKTLSPIMVSLGIMNAALFALTVYAIKTDNGRKPLF